MQSPSRILVFGLGVMILTVLALLPEATAFDRYQDGCNSSGCHGDFTDPVSQKGSIFPGDSKHTMHRGNQYMNAECNLCHRSDDGNNPFIGSSDGTADNPGLGCTGCHTGGGLRQHHFNTGNDFCYQCHSSDPAETENTVPVYYGTADTNVTDPCNTVGTANTGENWTVTDTIGLDNDGDNVYDAADSDCATSSGTPGEVDLLTVSGYNPATGAVDLAYSVGCGTSDNILVWGDLAQVSTYNYSGQLCAIGNGGTLNWTPPAGNLFFLLVGNDGTAEGSYGMSSIGTERPEEAVCAFTQDLSNTCVN